MLPKRVAVIVAAAVMALVVWNCAMFQRATSELETITDELASGVHGELEAQWADATSHYRRAAEMAADPASRWAKSTDPGSTWFARNSELSWNLVDPEPLLLAMNVSWNHPELASAARYGEARALLLQGDTRAAATALDAACERDARFEAARFDLAEALWGEGEYAAANRFYEKVAKIPSEPNSAADIARIGILRKRADAETGRRHFTSLDNHWRSALVARVAVLAPRSDEGSALERAMQLRRLGRWQEAVGLYRAIVARNPGCAEALRHLEIAQKIGGNPANMQIVSEPAPPAAGH